MKFFRRINHPFSQEILGMNARNFNWIYKENQGKACKWANDKVLTKERLHDKQLACAPTYAVIKSLSEIESVWDKVSSYKALALKPANGYGGGGIKILKKDDKGGWHSGEKPVKTQEIFLHMAQIIQGVFSSKDEDQVLIEYCIEAHPFLLEIYPKGVADFRVILLRDQPIMAMLRVPTQESDGKANLHQGGMGIGIDIDTGNLTYGFDGKTYHSKHPDTHTQLLGSTIPQWKQLLELSVRTSQAFENLNYLGIDIVIDQNLGPLILEINVRPGLAIQLVNRQGLSPMLEKTQQLLQP